MKTRSTMPLAIHKTFEKPKVDAKREVTFYVSDGTGVEVIPGKHADKLIDSIPSGHSVRMTSVHACDPLLLDMAGKGVKIRYAYWHDTGFEKGLESGDLVHKYANLPDSLFREFMPRPELAELRHRVSQRQAVLEFRKAATLKLKGSARLMGQLQDEDYDEGTQALLADIAQRTHIKLPVTRNGVTKDVYIDDVIAEQAQDIRECVLFNEAAGIGDSWNTAATVVGFLGGVDRFGSVSSLWHYCGEHVVDGHSPKRKKGSPVDWSPKVRTALWQMSDSIIKNRNNRWRPVYEQMRDKELADHDVKCPDCKTPAGHCGARARRRVRKEILKEFFLACNGGQKEGDTHALIAEAVTA